MASSEPKSQIDSSGTTSTDDVQQIKQKRDTQDRDNQEWGNKIEYMLSCVSYGVGLGNLWRFPYLCFEHKGFTFLIPYFICLFSCGLPLCILEGCLGQFTASGPVKVWRMAPVFEGVGWGEMFMSGTCTVYYNVIVAYALYYLIVSLPFYEDDRLPYDSESKFCNDEYKPLLLTKEKPQHQSCAEYYYNKEILKDSGLDTENPDFLKGLGSLNMPLIGTFFLAWGLIYWSQSQGTKTTGKLSYVTSLLPYFCLTALFIGTIRLDGATQVGISEYVQVNMTHLATAGVWKAAAQQVFFSQGAAWGVLIIFSSHNQYRMNVFSRSWQLSCINAATSVYGGFVVFSTLGFLAYSNQLNLPENQDLVAAANVSGNYSAIYDLARANFDSVVGQTHKLAFVVYPVAITQMPMPFVWAILFFVMLTTLGVGSQVGMFMCVYEGIMEKLKIKDKKKQTQFLILMVAIQIILAYPMMTSAGIKWLNVFDWSVCALSIFIFGFLETMAVSWVYGIDKFMMDIEEMLMFKLPYRQVWMFAWSYLTPGFCFVLICVNFYTYIFSNGFKIATSWPAYANVIGWIIQLVQIVPIGVLAYKNWGKGLQQSHYNNQRRQQSNEEKTKLIPIGNGSQSSSTGSEGSLAKKHAIV